MNEQLSFSLSTLNDFPSGTVVKNPLANAGDTRDSGLIPGLERFPGAENANPLQYSCLENSMDREAWRATVHGVTKSQRQQLRSQLSGQRCYFKAGDTSSITQRLGMARDTVDGLPR